MIKINLVPVDELENQLWWVADAAVLLIVACASFFASQWYLGTIQEQTDEISARASGLEDSIRSLESEVSKFDGLTEKEATLNATLKALQNITGDTKIKKFEPVIVLEHLQNLKPEGIWFSKLELGKRDKTFKIFGQGFDNLLLAEFMTGIRSTETQEKDDSDLRTHIFFAELELVNSAVGSASTTFPDVGTFPSFELSGKVYDKNAGSAPANLDAPEAIEPLTVSQGSDANRVRF